ncbi:MAG: protein kinase domain-containing protein [Panacagrimonas sp.]
MAGSLTDLSEEQWPTFSGLLDAALDLPSAQHEAWLQALAPQHQVLRPHLEAALQADAALRAKPSAGRPQIQVGGDLFEFRAGSQIGPYALSEPLGRGGMGEVWRAQRSDGTLTREVALKLPHTWLLTAGMRQRLSRERDFLAGLTHPNIAQLYDAGIAEDGQPWLALERIEGQRIDHHCRQQRLSVDARLNLFDQVLGAVQAAHSRLIVHRDLKPSNILVTAAGTVKLLDFGIAKLIDEQGSGESTELTRLAGRAATPEYAAPEQLAGDTVTVGTDIYSLGIVLYELLCGQRPFSTARSLPLRPADRYSAPLASTQVVLSHADQVGGLMPRDLRRALSGNLDAILAKALAADPRHRYASVERFNDDLHRHRRSEPIQARHITRIERAGMFARRHRIALTVAALFLLTVIGGLSASLWQARRATLEALRANATRDFLLKVIDSNSRLQAGDREPGSTTIREMLDGIVDGADAGLGEQPQTRLELLDLAKQIYRQWYAKDRVVKAHEQYRQLVAQLDGPRDARIIESLIEQSSIYLDYHDGPEPRTSLLKEAGRLIGEAGLRGTLIEAQWLAETGRDAFPPVGTAPEALDHFQAAVAIYDAQRPPDVRQRWPRFFLTQALWQTGRPDEARALALKNIAFEQSIGKDRNDWLIAWQTVQLGHYERERGKLAAARTAYERAENLVLATFGRGVNTYQEARLWNATLAAWAGETEAAQALFEQENALLAAESPEESDGEGPAWFRLAYGRFLVDQGRAAEALPLLEQAARVEITSRPVVFRRADAVLAAGDAHATLGHTKEAREHLRAAHEMYVKLGRPDFEGALEARERWARFAFDHGDPMQAQAEFAAVLQHAGHHNYPAVARARMGLARLAHLHGDPAEARRLGDQALSDLDAVRALYNPRLRADLQAQLDALGVAPWKIGV